jgi:pyruvate/2-oxoglutarate/acetoin dehydrogenase E1 component
VEVDFAGFLFVALDQLINNAAKLRYMSGGQVRVPMLLRVGQGAMGSLGAQHTSAPHAMFLGVPGLALCTPSNPQDAYDLVRWSLRQDDPVVFAEDVRLYKSKGPMERREPPGRAENSIARHGRDVTVVTFGNAVRVAETAAEELSREGIEIEIVDVKFLAPLDRSPIGESSRRTGRVICVADDPLMGGVTATLAAIVEEEAYAELQAPVLRLGSKHTPAPFSPALERTVFPTRESIEAAARMLLEEAVTP